MKHSSDLMPFSEDIAALVHRFEQFLWWLCASNTTPRGIDPALTNADREKRSHRLDIQGAIRTHRMLEKQCR